MESAIDSTAYAELATVWEEVQAPGWDGFGANAVDHGTMRFAFRLLKSLPPGLPVPSIGAEPHGNLTLEWHQGPRRTISVSVDGEGNLHYAALIGPIQAYGTVAFRGEFPAEIQQLIERVHSACPKRKGGSDAPD